MNIRTATTEDVDAIHELGKAVEEFAVNDETETDLRGVNDLFGSTEA